MKLKVWSVAFLLMAAASGQGQTGNESSAFAAVVYPPQGATFAIQGTSLEREQLIRSQIQVMRPTVLPSRVVFVPHWLYIYATKVCHLQVPSGMTSKMFTHLASRTIYIDADRYEGADWLGHWVAHELGHLEANNADENEAEKLAAAYRRRLKQNAIGSR